MLQRHALYPAGTMQSVVTINGGSSSIRFALYESRAVLTKRVAGKLERIGLEGPTLTVTEAGSAAVCTPIAAGTHHEAAESLMNWLDAHPSFGAVSAVGHRVVHGMSHTRPARVTGELLAELRRITPYDPEHLPGGIPDCRRWPASTPRFTAPCRGSRRFCPFRAATPRRGFSAMVFTACRISI